MSKVNTLLRTISHLKPIQAVYQVKNRVIPKKPLKHYQLEVKGTQVLPFVKVEPVSKCLQVVGNDIRFTFLNLEKSFKDKVDWNDQSHGKLWNYNLQYLDFLKQDSIALTIKVQLCKDIYSQLWDGLLPLEPYPASLRIMNMIRFLENHELEVADKIELQTFVLAELHYLRKNLEYHLLGNHLLENAFALWMGTLYFQQEQWLSKAQNLLSSQLQEQVLPDGAHYELAPMYHQIILFRVLEACHFTPVRFVLNQTLKSTAEKMLAWMDAICLPDGSLPHFNDTTNGIAYTPAQLKTLAGACELMPNTTVQLKESGYRRFDHHGFTLIADVEGIKPTYQPGHAHADTFSFVLYHGQKPIIVDPGISTYTISERRDWERSTQAHNTVVLGGQNSSEVWAGFRVGRRAEVKLLKDELEILRASHNGYDPMVHQRSFILESKGFSIEDMVKVASAESIAYFHFHPDVSIQDLENGNFLIDKHVHLHIEGASGIQLESYQMAVGYHRLISSKRLVIRFEKDQLKTQIYQHL